MGSASDRPRRAGKQDRATPGEVTFTGARERSLRSRRGGLQPLVWVLCAVAVLLGVGLASAAAPWNPDVAQPRHGASLDADVGDNRVAPAIASAGGRPDGGESLSR